MGSKWNTNYWVVPVSYFRSESTGTPERVFLFFRTECSKRKFVFHFQALAAVIWKRNCMISTNDKRDSGAKFTSPEFYRQKQRDLSRKTLYGLFVYLLKSNYFTLRSFRKRRLDIARKIERGGRERKIKNYFLLLPPLPPCTGGQ